MNLNDSARSNLFTPRSLGSAFAGGWGKNRATQCPIVALFATVHVDNQSVKVPTRLRHQPD
jgi:hypothetical protein